MNSLVCSHTTSKAFEATKKEEKQTVLPVVKDTEFGLAPGKNKQIQTISM